MPKPFNWKRTPKAKLPTLDPSKRITPEQYAQAGTEHAHQVAVFIWANDTMLAGHFPELRWLAAIPNGGLRDPVTANKLKAEGVKSGFPDIMLPIVRGASPSFGGYHGLFVELKKPKVGRVSGNQSEWHIHLNAEGYRCVTCYGWIEARDAIVAYLTGR